MRLAVCGLHLRDGALNHQLVSLNATFVEQTKSSPYYTMHALHVPNAPSKPAMVRHPPGTPGCQSIELEIWDLPEQAIGPFLKLIPPPLALGTVILHDGLPVHGFVAEGWAADPSAAAAMGVESQDITQYGGWRSWLQTQS